MEIKVTIYINPPNAQFQFYKHAKTHYSKCSDLTTQVNQALKIVLEQSLTQPRVQINTADDCDLYLIQSLYWEKI